MLHYCAMVGKADAFSLEIKFLRICSNWQEWRVMSVSVRIVVAMASWCLSVSGSLCLEYPRCVEAASLPQR
jgi:hypothetical protein